MGKAGPAPLGRAWTLKQRCRWCRISQPAVGMGQPMSQLSAARGRRANALTWMGRTTAKCRRSSVAIRLRRAVQRWG
jgi:hypothetical protein